MEFLLAWLNNQTVSRLVLSSAVWIHSEEEDSLLVVFFFSLLHRLFLEIAYSKVRV